MPAYPSYGNKSDSTSAPIHSQVVTLSGSVNFPNCHFLLHQHPVATQLTTSPQIHADPHPSCTCTQVATKGNTYGAANPTQVPSF